MLEDDAKQELCIEPLDGVRWWRVTERCAQGGLNLRAAPDRDSASLGRAARHTVLKATAPPIIPPPPGSRYCLQLRRWRVSSRVAPGCLNCRENASKDAARLLQLPAGTVVEAIGPPQTFSEGEWLPISLADNGLKGWVILMDRNHKVKELQTAMLLDPLDGDAPWLKVSNPLSPGTSAYCLMHDSDRGVTLLEPLPDASEGIGTVYECVTPTVVRAGLDALSTQLGELDVGDEVVALETTVHSGRVRVKFSFSAGGGDSGGTVMRAGEKKGWASVTSGSGGAILRAKRERNLDEQRGGDESGNGWVGGEERTVQWLELNGASLESAHRICKNFRDAGSRPEVWLGQLNKMEGTTVMMLIDESNKKLEAETRRLGVMRHASELMVAGQYDAALTLYGQVLSDDPYHDEARRGVSEAEKGKRLSSMTEEEVMAQIAAMQLHAGLGMDEAEAPGSSKVRASQIDRAGGGAVLGATPTQPAAYRDGHGVKFVRVCVRLPPDASSSAGEQGFDVQYGTRFKPGWETVTVQGVPDGDAGAIWRGLHPEGYTWVLLVDNLAPNTNYIIRCRTNDGRGAVGRWSLKSKPMATFKDK
jgi:hypothetical protein